MPYPSGAPAAAPLVAPGVPAVVPVLPAPPLVPPAPPLVPPPAPPVVAPPAQPAWPSSGIAGSYDAQWPGYYASAPVATGQDPRIRFLVVTEIVIGIVGLLVAATLFSWAGYRYSENDMKNGNYDLIVGVAYLVTSLATFVVAWGLWSLRRWAWLSAFILALVLLGLLVFVMVVWEVTVLDLIGVSAYASVLGCLSLGDVRRLYWRPKTGP
jgi:hypothetical protein